MGFTNQLVASRRFVIVFLVIVNDETIILKLKHICDHLFFELSQSLGDENRSDQGQEC